MKVNIETSEAVGLVTRPLSIFVCAVINSQIDLGDVTGDDVDFGDVTETNRTQAPKLQKSGN